jgi:hypothetical protein
MELNNILTHSLDALVEVSLKLFVDTNLLDFINANHNVNVPLNADEIDGVLGFFADCDAYLQETRDNGAVEWDGDNVITGRYTMEVAVNHLTNLHGHRDRLLANRDELLAWAATADVEAGEGGNADAEFFAILYHAYLKLRTDTVMNVYREIKTAKLEPYLNAMH